MSEPAPNTISITLRMTDQHDIRAVRLLLKRLLRSYGLRCTGLAKVDDNLSAMADKTSEEPSR